MGHSAYIGRIGALAFALGVGIGLGATPAVALADDSDTSVSPPAADTPASEPDTEDTDTEDEDAPDDEDEDVRDRPHRASDAGEESEPEPEAEVDADEPETVVEDTADVLTEAAPPEPEPEPEPGPAPEPAAPVAEPAEAPASTSVPVIASPPPVPDRAPEAPAESALWLTVAASAVRRESDTPTSPAAAGLYSTLLTPAEIIRRLAEILIPGAPTDLVATDTHAYVAHTGSRSVTIIDTVAGRVVQTVSLRSAPTALAIAPNGTRLYVSHAESGTVSVISTATNSVVRTIRVGAAPTGIAVSRSGSRLYVVNGDDGTVSKISTLTNRVVGTVYGVGKGVSTIAVSPDGATLLVARAGDGKLSVFDIASGTELTSVIADPHQVAGPPTITVSPDGTQLYWTDSGSNRMQVIALVAANGNPTAQTPIVNSPNASGAVTGSVVVTDPEGAPLSYTVSGPGKGSVTVSRATDGTFVFTYTPTKAARHDAAKVTAGPAARVDTFTLTFSDGLRGTVAVPITVTIAPANAAPTATARSSVSWLSAKVHGTVTAKDADRDTLTFTASPTAKGGTVTIGADGKFTYTPTAAARHAAANAGATQADKQDTFTVLVNDGHGGVTSLTVTVKVKPGNAAPKATVRTNASWFSAKVFGTVTARDADRDALTYSASATAKNGVVTMDSRGRFTYTPTDAARHAAASATATDADRRDTFDVVVDDGHGGVTRLAVTVTIKPLNAAPTRAAVGGVFTNPNTGLTTGRITAVDPDGDTLSYRVATNTGKGVVTVGADGTFSYVPTDQARAAAAKRFAPSWDRTDRFRVTVDDGHGGTSTLTVRVAIAPAGYTNQAPTNGGYSLAHSDPVSGKVTGTVTATDPERDAVVFVGAGDAGKGSVVVDRSGGFVYTPRDDARRRAGAADATAADRQDTFTVLVLDAYGDGTTISVVVPVVGVPVV